MSKLIRRLMGSKGLLENLGKRVRPLLVTPLSVIRRLIPKNGHAATKERNFHFAFSLHTPQTSQCIEINSEGTFISTNQYPFTVAKNHCEKNDHSLKHVKTNLRFFGFLF